MAKQKEHDPEFLAAAYREMLFYRRFEEAANRAYNDGKYAGFCHLHIGQEAVCVGVQRALRDSDYVISGYRSHTQAIAKGIDPKEVMAELFGKKTGSVMGKGGSMHMFNAEKRFLGGHGIVGGQVPLGTGAAFRIRYKDEDDICVCYFGDGASNQGQVFEAMNLAATWKLPVLYVIENNQFGMGTDFRRVTSVDQLSKRALAFDMDHSDCDGMSFLSVYDHVVPIVESMRKDPKPYLLEIMTYRYRGHSVSDPATYRTKEELNKFQDRDPITELGKVLISHKSATQSDLDEWDKATKKQIKEIVAYADQAEQPEDEIAYMHIWSE